MSKAETFLTPFNNSEAILHDAKEDLAEIARALHLVGNANLADKLGRLGVELNDAMKLIEQGRQRVLKHYVEGSEAATTNMIRAALAVNG